MAMQASVPRIGDFELLAKLGEGGMGAVYKARQLSLDRVVALKILPRRLAADPAETERFLKEARATAKLSHPHIVAGIGVGCADGYYYFAMEYIAGKTLKQRICAEKCLPEGEVLEIGAAIALALAHAHQAGFVHRDVKPDNILLDAHGTPKLADLGLSKRADDANAPAGAAVGTPHYMSPEQARGQADIDGRADTYALGCTLYHALTGRTPFEGSDPAVLMTKHLSEKIQHPQNIRPDLSDDCCAVLTRMVARRAEDRYASLTEAADDLNAVLQGQAPLTPALPPARSNFTLPASATSRRLPTGEHPKPGKAVESQTTVRQAPIVRPAILIGGLAAIVLVLLLLVIIIVRRRAVDEEVRRPLPPRPASNIVPQAAAPLVSSQERVADSPPTPESLPFSELFNGRDLTGWQMQAPAVSVEQGCLVLSGQHGANAVLCRRRSLAHDFELLLTATNSGSFHFGWSGKDDTGSNYIHRLPGGKVSLSRYSMPTPDNYRKEILDTAEAKAPDGTHTYRVVVKGKSIRVYIDGSLCLQTDKGSLAGSVNDRDLSIYSASSTQTRYRDIRCRPWRD